MKKQAEGHFGHFGKGTGASSIVDEVTEVQKIGKRIHEILTAYGVDNTLYEDKVSKNKNQNIPHLVAHHNKDTDGIVFSYHLNASGAKTKYPIGCEVLYVTQKALAAELSAAIASAGGFINRGAKFRNNLGVLTGTKEPAVILEFFFVNSEEDVRLYRQNFESICMATAKVIAKAVGHEIKERVPLAPEPSVVTKIGYKNTEGANVARIQSGLFTEKEAAESAALASYFPYYELIEYTDGWRIQSGKYPSVDAAETAASKSMLPYATIIGYKE